MPISLVRFCSSLPSTGRVPTFFGCSRCGLMPRTLISVGLLALVGRWHCTSSCHRWLDVSSVGPKAAFQRCGTPGPRPLGLRPRMRQSRMIDSLARGSVRGNRAGNQSVPGPSDQALGPIGDALCSHASAQLSPRQCPIPWASGDAGLARRGRDGAEKSGKARMSSERSSIILGAPLRQKTSGKGPHSLRAHRHARGR